MWANIQFKLSIALLKSGWTKAKAKKAKAERAEDEKAKDEKAKDEKAKALKIERYSAFGQIPKPNVF